MSGKTIQYSQALATAVAVVLGIGVVAWRKKRAQSRPTYKFEDAVAPVDESFDWREEKPRPYRPFRAGKFHMTMGVKKLPADDWLLLENTYDDLTDRRAQIVDDYRDHTVLSHPMADEPLKEVYEMTLDYLQKKYPQYFVKEGDQIVNKIKGSTLHASAEEYPTVTAMIRNLARNIEEDFLVLMYDEEEEQYYLRGGSFAFPSGFDPAAKLNTALKDIHGPVPLYKEKLEKSMDRYFAKMQVGQWVERFNWSFQTHTNYYALSENHAAEDELDIKPIAPDDMDFDTTFMRCERQILTRLPKTKALLFTIRSYITPMAQVRAEGRNEDLISAIDNIPDAMAHYKKRREWGDAVKAYLRYQV